MLHVDYDELRDTLDVFASVLTDKTVSTEDRFVYFVGGSSGLNLRVFTPLVRLSRVLSTTGEGTIDNVALPLDKLLTIVKSFSKANVSGVSIEKQSSEVIITVTEGVPTNFLTFWESLGSDSDTSQVKNTYRLVYSNAVRDFVSQDSELVQYESKSLQDMLSNLLRNTEGGSSATSNFVRTTDSRIFVINSKFGVFYENPMSDLQGITLTPVGVKGILGLLKHSDFVELGLSSSEIRVVSGEYEGYFRVGLNKVSDSGFDNISGTVIEFDIHSETLRGILSKTPWDAVSCRVDKGTMRVESGYASDAFVYQHEVPVDYSGEPFGFTTIAPVLMKAVADTKGILHFVLKPMDKSYLVYVTTSDKSWTVIHRFGRIVK